MRRTAVSTGFVIATLAAVLAGRVTAQGDVIDRSHPGDHAVEQPAVAQPAEPATDALANHDRLGSSLQGWLGLSLSLIGIAGLIGIAALIWALGTRNGSAREHDFAGGRSSTMKR